jgi:hypothetical protein
VACHLRLLAGVLVVLSRSAGFVEDGVADDFRSVWMPNNVSVLALSGAAPLADVDATVVDVEVTIWAGELGGGALTAEVVLFRRARSAASRAGDPSGAANGFALVGVVDSEVVATL